MPALVPLSFPVPPFFHAPPQTPRSFLSRRSAKMCASPSQKNKKKLGRTLPLPVRVKRGGIALSPEEMPLSGPRRGGGGARPALQNELVVVFELPPERFCFFWFGFFLLVSRVFCVCFSVPPPGPRPGDAPPGTSRRSLFGFRPGPARAEEKPPARRPATRPRAAEKAHKAKIWRGPRGWGGGFPPPRPPSEPI